jgi:hypothetical protein
MIQIGYLFIKDLKFTSGYVFTFNGATMS